MERIKKDYIPVTSEAKLIQYLLGLMAYYSMVRGKDNACFSIMQHRFNKIIKTNYFFVKTNSIELLPSKVLCVTIFPCISAYGNSFPFS